MSERKTYFQEILSDSEFRSFIRETILDGIRDCSTICTLPEEMRKNMATWSDTVESIGDGNIKRGIERIRKNNEFVYLMRQAKKTTVKWIMKPIITGATKFVLTVFATLVILYIAKGGKLPL